jgi:hypothetical protein
LGHKGPISEITAVIHSNSLSREKISAFHQESITSSNDKAGGNLTGSES